MHLSVFSHYLDPLREVNLICLTDNPKVGEIYEALRIAYNQGVSGILSTTRMIAPISESEDNYDIIEEVWRNEYLKKELQWINLKITLCIGVESIVTLRDVRLRIATNKLLKLVKEEKISWNIYDRIHYYLCKNVINEASMILDEDLPF